MLITQSIQANVFCGTPDIQGNPLLLTFCSRSLKTQNIIDILAREKTLIGGKNEPAHAIIWPQTTREFTLRVFQYGHEIQCCGHALVAAGDYLLTNSPAPSLTINREILVERNSQHRTQAYLPRVLTKEIAQQPWHAKLLREKHTTIKALSQTPSKRGYLLLELEAHAKIANLDLDLALLCRHEQRALVLFNRPDDNKSIIKMRYFAPQYGNIEDNATGSAARVLGDYLALKYQIYHFTIEQASTTGGLIFAEVNDNNVAISGQVQYKKR